MTATITGRTDDELIVTITADFSAFTAAMADLEVRARAAQRAGRVPVTPGRCWSPDAHRYDASRAEAEAEMAEWDAILSGARARRA